MTAEERRQISKDHQSGMRLLDIAEKYGTTYHNIWDNLKLYHLETEEEVKQRKINAERVVELHSKGLTDAEIAAEMGESRGAIGQIRRRKGLPNNNTEHNLVAKGDKASAIAPAIASVTPEPTTEEERPEEAPTEEAAPEKETTPILSFDEWISARYRVIADAIIADITSLQEIKKEYQHEHELLVYMIKRMKEAL